ncbi:hypothetical protein EON65_25425 [archaeon]|nr:MAG: hypothetical protein EON65_25425 [archaeon]
MLMKSLDQNNDGVVSGREFMTWLIPSNGIDEKSVLANELKRLVIERFAGDVRRMFEAFKR